MLAALLIPLALAVLIYALTLVCTALVRRAVPRPEAIALGAITNFFDTLGVGSFAPTMSWFKFRRLVPDRLIPCTMLVGHTLPAVAQAIIFLIVLGVLVDPVLLIGCVLALLMGGLLGVSIVIRAKVWVVQLVVFHEEEAIERRVLRENDCMKERTSKLLLSIESGIFLAPVSFVTALYGLSLVRMYTSGALSDEPLLAHAAPMFTFVGLTLQLCGWRVVAAFLSDGRHGIQAVAPIYVYASVVGAVLVAGSGLVFVLLLAGVQLPDSFELFTANLLAVPALVPFTHVMIERWRSRRDLPGPKPAGEP